MADRILLESGAPDGYLLEDGSGVLLNEVTVVDGTFDTTGGGATAAGGRTGIVVGTATNNSGTTTSTGTTVTLPSGIADGDVAYMVVSMNTATDRGDPSGWDLLDFTTSSTTLQQKVYRKSVGASDSSTAVSWTLSNAQKWAIAVVVTRNDVVDVEGTAWALASSVTAWQFNSITPVNGDDVLWGFHSWRVSASGTTTSSAPTGWTELAETSTNATSSPTMGVGVLDWEVSGGAGVSVGGATDGSYDGPTANPNISLVVAAKGPTWAGNATFDTTVGTATASGGSTTFDVSGSPDGTFDTLAGDAPAAGGSTSFTGGATFDTAVGDAPASGGDSTFTGGAAFTTTVGDAPAAGGSSSFTGTAVFDTVVGEAVASGGSTTFDTSTDATFTTTAGDAPASGGDSSFTGTATFTTTAGDAPASGGSTSFTGTATFDTAAGTATADGGSSSFTGSATFDTAVGTATAEGGVTTFDTAGDGNFTTTAGDAPAAGGDSTFTGTAVFDTSAATAPAEGGTSTFTGGATFDTGAGSATADGGSTAFTGTAVFDTLAGEAIASGGSTTFDAGSPGTFTTTEGTATAAGGTTSFTGDATFDSIVGELIASGGVTTFTGDQEEEPQPGGSPHPGYGIDALFRPPIQPQPEQPQDAVFGADAAPGVMVMSGGSSTFTGTTAYPLTVEGFNEAVLELV